MPGGMREMREIGEVWETDDPDVAGCSEPSSTIWPLKIFLDLRLCTIKKSFRI